MKPEEMQVTPLVSPDGTHQGYVRGDGAVALFFSPAEQALREALRAAKSQLAERDEQLRDLGIASEAFADLCENTDSDYSYTSNFDEELLEALKTLRETIATAKAVLGNLIQNFKKSPAQSGQSSSSEEEQHG